MRNTFTNTFLVLIILGVIPFLSIGQVRQSTNYKIELDSINIGGGYSSSTNYQSQSTVGESATGYSSSTNYALQAGYQQVNEATYLTISAPSDVNMSSINGLTGGTSDSTISWTVITNNNAGYTLDIKAGSSPAMILSGGGDSFSDYTPTGANPDFSFGISNTDAEFGFTVEGTDTSSRFKDDGVDCNTGSGNVTDKCWDAFSTSDTRIAQSASSNDPSGVTTNVKIRAESGTSRILTAGSYQATLTVTGLAL